MIPELIRPDQLAKRLGVAQGTIYVWAARGLIPHIRLEKCIRFDPQEIQEWLRVRRVAARKSPGGRTGDPAS